MSVLGIIVTGIMFLCILLIPLGLPGTWLEVGIITIGAILSYVSWVIVLVVFILALIAEVLEFLIVRAMSARYGGTPAVFWGAIVGGIIGVFVGVPIPVFGSVAGGVLGSFLGAVAVSVYRSRDLLAASRVGWGVVLARGMAAFVKVATGFVILVLGGTAWILH